MSKFAFLSLLCALLAVSKAGATQAGAAAEQQKALAEFQRLRDLNLQAQKNILKRQEVTQQSLDTKPSQK